MDERRKISVVVVVVVVVADKEREKSPLLFPSLLSLLLPFFFSSLPFLSPKQKRPTRQPAS